MKISKYFLILFFVLIIPVSAQAAFGLDENIKQVKTPDSSAVYYLDHAKGIKKAYINEQAFLSYGNKWEDIKTIMQTELDKWPEVQVVKTKADLGVYYLKAGQKTLIKSAKDFVSLGFKWSEIVSLNENDLSQYAEATYEKVGLALYKLVDYELVKAKSSSAVYYIKNKLKVPIKSARDFLKLGFKWDDINVVEDDDLSDYNQVNYDEVGLKIPATGQVEVSLDKSNPKNSQFPLNTNNHLLGVFNLKSKEARAEIYSLTFSLEGIFSLSIIDNVYIVDESGANLGIIPGSSEKDFTFNFVDNPLIISPNGVRKIFVSVDLSDCSDCTKYNLGVSIKQAVNVNSDSEIIGSFPVASGLATLVDALDILGQASIEEESVSEANLEAIIGEAEQVLGRFKVKEISGNEDIIIKKLAIENQGTAQASYFSNFKLKNKAGKIVSQVDAMTASGEIIFIVDNYEIKKNSEETFTILANLNDGDGLIINFKLINASVVGANINFGLKVNYSNLFENINITRKGVGAIAKKLKASKKVFAAKAGTIVGVFEIRNSDQIIYLDSFDLSLIKSSGAPKLEEDVYLVNYDTGEVLGQTSSKTLDSGQVNINILDNIIKPKKSFTLAFITNMPEIFQGGYNYQLVLNNINYRTDNNFRLQDKANVKGVALEVTLSKLAISPNPDFINESYTKGEPKIKVASFYLESSAGDDINITGLAINKGSLNSSLTYANGFSNLKVYIGSKRLATIEQPDKTAYNFGDFSYKLRAGKRVEIKIYVDSDKDLKITEADIKITALIAVSYSSGIDTAVSGLDISSNKISFVEAQAKVETIAGGTISAETEDNIVGSFKITNTGGEELKLNYLTLSASGNGLSYSFGYESLTLNRINEKDKVKRVGSSISKPVAGANRLNMGSFRLSPGSEVIIYVYVDTVENMDVADFKIYISKLEASGYSSKVVAEIEGAPTAELDVIVGGE